MKDIVTILRYLVIITVISYFAINVIIGFEKVNRKYCKKEIFRKEIVLPRRCIYDFKNDTVTVLNATGLTEFNFKYHYIIMNQDSFKYELETNRNFNINDKIIWKDSTLKMSYIIFYNEN